MELKTYEAGTGDVKRRSDGVRTGCVGSKAKEAETDVAHLEFCCARTRSVKPEKVGLGWCCV